MKTFLALFTAVSFTMLAHAKKEINPPRPSECIFGEDIGTIAENARFQLTPDVIKTFKIARSVDGMTDTAGKPPMVTISIIKDKSSKKVYHINVTFRNIDDGDNTWGWIEEVNDAEKNDSGVANESRVVADIRDSSIDSCLVH